MGPTRCLAPHPSGVVLRRPKPALSPGEPANAEGAQNPDLLEILNALRSSIRPWLTWTAPAHQLILLSPTRPPALKLIHTVILMPKTLLLSPTFSSQACVQASSLWSDAALLDRLLYKNTHQHRGSHFLRYLKEVRER